MKAILRTKIMSVDWYTTVNGGKKKTSYSPVKFQISEKMKF